MHLILGLLALLLAAPSFEGEWNAELPGPTGEDSKIRFLCEIKTDGTLLMSATDKDGKNLFVKQPGKWKKTGDKTIKMTMDNGAMEPGIGELIDEKTLVVTAPDREKLKFIKK